MSLLMGELDSIARCAAQYRSERLAALGLKSCHASYLMGICDCPGISQEQLARRIYQNKSAWPGSWRCWRRRVCPAGVL
ncbi:MAG: hypothetical protein ACLU9S_24200 [Oscillospiraceae bacterium]